MNERHATRMLSRARRVIYAEPLSPGKTPPK